MHTAPEKGDILRWLATEDEVLLEKLWRKADTVRKECVGDAVHLRGLVEISNYCVRGCTYCGINRDSRIERYRMAEPEIMECVFQAVKLGYGTVVFQAGEDYGIETAWVVNLIRRIKSETPLAITLGLGERPDEDLAAWRAAGADRYLLKFETSNRVLYDAIHPPYKGRVSDRIDTLRRLKSLGYQTGSGVMIGIPGQTLEDLASDIELFGKLELDMIGVGPYIPHPRTMLGEKPANASVGDRSLARNDELTACKVMALARLVCPYSNIPATTALATIDRASGFELALSRGANVVMPNLTPHRYRRLYDIYPGKVFAYDNADDYDKTLKRRIVAIGRSVGQGRGDTIVVRNRKSAPRRKS